MTTPKLNVIYISNQPQDIYLCSIYFDCNFSLRNKNNYMILMQKHLSAFFQVISVQSFKTDKLIYNVSMKQSILELL